MSRVLWSLHGPLSHSSNTVPRPGVGFGFLGIGSGNLHEFARLVRTQVLVRSGLSQNSVWVFQTLSIAQYFRTMAAKSAKCAMSWRLMVLRIPLSMHFLQKNEIASSSRQSLTLLITRRNLAQKWCTVSWGSCIMWERSVTP